MGVKRADLTYECDRCGTTTTVPNDPSGRPAGWIMFGYGTPGVDWFCGWACIKEYADKMLRVAEAEAS